MSSATALLVARLIRRSAVKIGRELFCTGERTANVSVDGGVAYLRSLQPVSFFFCFSFAFPSFHQRSLQLHVCSDC
jgi:hypothetical protein